MKAILMSIKPKWCEKICRKIGEENGIPVYLKPVEVRKSAPKEVPFKAYIYATKPKKWFRFSSWGCTSDECLWLSNGKVKMCDGFEFWADGKEYEPLCGKVIGEFICDKVDCYPYGDMSFPTPAYDGDPTVCECGNGYYITCGELEKTCLEYKDLENYGKSKTLYGWHITDLKIYDKPRELGEFSRYGYKDIEHAGSGCVFCGNTQCKHSNPEEVVAGHYIPPICKIGGCTIKRAPQSWQYVEEV